jgi:hypothetical protein
MKAQEWTKTRVSSLIILAMLFHPIDFTAQSVDAISSQRPIAAFKVRGSISPEQFSKCLQQIKDDLFQGVENNDVMIRYRIVLLRGTPPEHLEVNVLRVLYHADPEAKLIKLPVIRSEGGLEIPTGQVTVQFTANVSEAAAQRVLMESDLSIIGGPRSELPGRYVAIDKDDDIQRLMESTKRLNSNRELIRFAELDTLQLQKVL